MEKNIYASGILQYIRFFYVIWSDDLVSASEISIVEKAISNDTGLNKDENSTLLSWLSATKPPKDETFKQWKHTISSSQVLLIESETYPLATFSQKVVCHYYDSCPFNNSLKDIEINLGIQPNHYNHLFDVDVVQEIYSDHYKPSEIDSILKGDNATVVDNFRNALNHPVFKWEVHRNKENLEQPF